MKRRIPMSQALGDDADQTGPGRIAQPPDRSWWMCPREDFHAELAKQVPRWQGRGTGKPPSDIGIHRAPKAKGDQR